MAPIRIAVISILLLLLSQASPLLSELDELQSSEDSYKPGLVPPTDVNSIEFPLNLEFLEAEFFLWSALGYGLDKAAPELVSGGPAPVGAQKANLDPLVREIIEEFAYQEVGHIRAIKATVPGFPRPQLNLTAANFATIMNAALNTTLTPPFNPYANSVNYLLASYVIPYVGLVGYVGTNPNLHSRTAKRLIAGLLGVESGQDAVIRSLLYEKLFEKVTPYSYTVAEFTDRISILRNNLGHAGIADEGLFVPLALGAEGKVKGNILAADEYSLSYGRSPAQILRIVYASGNESSPGGFYPRGANGKIARQYLST